MMAHKLQIQPRIIFEECDMTGNRGPQRILAIAAVSLFGAIGTANATLSGDFIDFVTSQESLLNIQVLDAQVEFDRFGGGAALDCSGPTPPAICNNLRVDRIDLAPSMILLGLGETGSTATFSFQGINTLIASIAVAFNGPSPFTANVQLNNNNIDISGVQLLGGGAITSGDIVMTLTFEQPPPGAPEPSTLLLLGAGLVGLWARRRRN
jgi:hypothetical protein